MGFLVTIISVLKTIGDWWNTAYLEVKSWPWPFNRLATPLLWASTFFYQLATLFVSFNDWVTYAKNMLATILSWTSIKGLIASWLPGIESAITWFKSWLSNVNSAISTWWSSMKSTVQGWINNAKNYLLGLIDDLDTLFINLKAQVQTLINNLPSINEILAWFKDWWGKILAPLTAWWNQRLLDIVALFNSWMKQWAPFWAGWQDVKNSVVAFISTPLDWLADKFTDWFLGKEE